MSDKHHILTYKEAARIANKHPKTVGKWVRDGYLLPSYHPGSTHRGIRKETLLRFLESLEQRESLGA